MHDLQMLMQLNYCVQHFQTLESMRTALSWLYTCVMLSTAVSMTMDCACLHREQYHGHVVMDGRATVLCAGNVMEQSLPL